MSIFFAWVILSIVAGSIGESRKIGFWTACLLSLFLSPLIGLIVAFASDKKTIYQPLPAMMVKLINEGDKLAANKKINEAIEKYRAALAYSDKAPKTNFKLAKLFSLNQDAKISLYHLAQAIQQGYKDFEKINHDTDLSFLRNTVIFKEFVNNGFKSSATQNEKPRSLSRIEELEKLDKLLEKGVLTNEEFENEKKRILSSIK